MFVKINIHLMNFAHVTLSKRNTGNNKAFKQFLASDVVYIHTEMAIIILRWDYSLAVGCVTFICECLGLQFKVDSERQYSYGVCLMKKKSLNY